MVSNVRSRSRQKSTDTASRDRGQVILIGAISLAFIVLGIVVVFNGILYTEALSSGASSQSEVDVNMVEYELEAGVSGLAHQGNLEWNAENQSDYESDMTPATEDFDEKYLNSKANSRPETSQIEVIGVDEEATVVRNESIDTLNVEIDNQVGHLEFEVVASGEDGNELEVTVDPEDGDSKSLTLVENGNETFTATRNGTSCTIEHDEPRLNLVTGDVLVPTTNNCDVSLIDSAEDYDTVTINNIDNVNGTYDIVTKGDGSIGNENHYGAWAVEVKISYESHDVFYERTKTVDVYEGRQ